MTASSNKRSAALNVRDWQEQKSLTFVVPTEVLGPSCTKVAEHSEFNQLCVLYFFNSYSYNIENGPVNAFLSETIDKCKLGSGTSSISGSCFSAAVRVWRHIFDIRRFLLSTIVTSVVGHYAGVCLVTKTLRNSRVKWCQSNIIIRNNNIFYSYMCIRKLTQVAPTKLII